MTKKDKKNFSKKSLKEDEIMEGEFQDEGTANDAPVEGTVNEVSANGSEEDVELDLEGMMVISQDEFNQLTQEVENAQKQARESLESWQRERADFTNYKRRVERDQQTLQNSITGEVIKKFLPVLDDMERALKTRPAEGQAAKWSEGIELIYRKLQNILEAAGVQPIAAENEEFNPQYHEAISYEDDPDHESGGIIEVVQQGYTLGDRVIRPALVRVAR